MRKVPIFLVAMLGCWPAFAQYTSIPGIPDPPFGLTQSAAAEPSPWSSSTTGWYLVGGSGCSDSTNGYTGAPRCTVPTSGAPAGSIVKVKASLTFTGQTSWNFANCTQSQPCIVRCEAGATISAATQQQLNLGGNYVIIENCGFSKIIIRIGIAGNDTTGVVLRGNSFTGITGSGSVIAWNAPGTNGHTNTVIYNNTIHDNGCVTTPCAIGDSNPATVPADLHGIKMSQALKLKRIWIIDNLSYRNAGDSFQIGTATTRAVNADDPQYIFIGRNTCYDDYENCIDVKTAQDIIISSNTMSQYYEEGPTDGGQGHGEAIVTHNKAARVWSLFNTIHTARTGIYYQDQSDEGWVIGNVIYNIQHDTTPGNGIDDTFDPTVLSTGAGTGSAIRFGSLDSTMAPAGLNAKYYAFHNTIADSDRGIISTMASTQACVVRDNVVSSLKLNGPNIGFNVAASHTISTVSNNYFEPSDGSNVMAIVGTTPYTSVSAYTTAFSGKCAGCSAGNPLFQNSAARNFKITSESSVIGGGSGDTSPYDRFDALYSAALFGGATGIIRKDRDGKSRPQGGTWDIGAYEFVSSANRHKQASGVLRGVKIR